MHTAAEWLSSAPVDRLIANARSTGLFANDPLWVARAPGRLDVMGGIADYTGSLVCEMPLAIAAGVLAQARHDGNIVCHSRQTGRTITLPAACLANPDPASLRKLVDKADTWALYLVGCCWLLAGRAPAHPATPEALKAGVTLLLDSDVPLGGGVSSSAAIEVATMTALTRLTGTVLSPMELAVACQAVENRVVGAPCGVMDQVTSCLGKRDSMLEILCQAGPDGLPAQVIGTVDVPHGYAFIGIHSGVSHEVSGDPYTDTRVAAFIAQRILEVDLGVKPLGHHLANIDASHYMQNLRDKLPESISGQDFLTRYGKTNDAVTTVKTFIDYHARRACDHHVLEADRVRRFVGLLKHCAIHPGQADTLVQQAGRLMYESHASYSDCALMGHGMTDRIVAAAEKLGPRAGFYGAKITGGGCGGTVALFIKDTPDVHQRVEMLISEYTQTTGRSTMLFVGSGPGAAELGAHKLSHVDLV